MDHNQSDRYVADIAVHLQGVAFQDVPRNWDTGKARHLVISDSSWQALLKKLVAPEELPEYWRDDKRQMELFTREFADCKGIELRLPGMGFQQALIVPSPVWGAFVERLAFGTGTVPRRPHDRETREMRPVL